MFVRSLGQASIFCFCSIDCQQAVDEDAESPNNVIEYSIMTADPDNAFEINTDTGEIMLKPFIKSMEIVQNITKEKECRWSLVVQARDRGSPSFSTTAVVNFDITEAVRPDFPHSITAALFMPRLSLKPVRSLVTLQRFLFQTTQQQIPHPHFRHISFATF